MTRTDTGADETLLAIRNALKLGGSLLFTWGIALAMRMLLPRYLGPASFGTLTFADAFAATFFVALSLGVDVYVRKQVAVRPDHASDFFGGTFVLRVVMSGAILGLIALVMHATGQPAEVRAIVYIFAVAQFFVTTNATLSALLHAHGAVGGMSVLAVLTKIAWAAGALLVIALDAGLWGFALAFLLPEAVESVVLFRLARRHMGLVFRIDSTATRAMVVFSLPYYLNTFATTAYGKLDVTWLALVASSREVGWYAAASAIAGLSLLVTPLIGWVLMPTFARAAARSHDELFERIRRSTELILSVAIPASLLITLAADVCIQTLFGAPFAPAAFALRILAPTFVITYVAIIYAITLLMLERAWTLTAISIAGLVVNVALNMLLVGPSLATFGDGGGGAGCAFAMLGTEIFVTTAMISMVGRRAFDRRTVVMLGKSALACALVVVVDRLALPIGWPRFVLDAAVYVAVVVGTGAVRTGELASVLKAALHRGEAKLTAGSPVAAGEDA